MSEPKPPLGRVVILPQCERADAHTQRTTLRLAVQALEDLARWVYPDAITPGYVQAMERAVDAVMQAMAAQGLGPENLRLAWVQSCADEHERPRLRIVPRQKEVVE